MAPGMLTGARPTEGSPTQISPAQVSLVQQSPTQVSPAQIGTIQGGSLQVNAAQVQQGATRVFIPGDQPVSEEQVRSKLQSEGWAGVLVTRDGQYLRATGAVGGKLRTVVIDAATGRLSDQGHNEPDDDDDD